jgi:hypothetical protein
MTANLLTASIDDWPKADKFYHNNMYWGLQWLDEEIPHATSVAAKRMLLATAFVESGLRNRRQIGNGTAKSFWMFERVTIQHLLVTTHNHVGSILRKACNFHNCAIDSIQIHSCIEGHDDLAVILARLLMHSKDYPIPLSQKDSYNYYIRTWKPGRPRPERWDAAYTLAAVFFPE